MNMSLISSNFTDEIQSHYDNSDADVLPPSSSEEETIDKTKKYEKEYHSKYYKEKQQQPYLCRICGKTLSDSSDIKRHEESQRCIEAKNNVVVSGPLGRCGQPNILPHALYQQPPQASLAVLKHRFWSWGLATPNAAP